MAKEFINIKLQVNYMMENEKMERDMAKEYMNFAMEIDMKVCGKKVINVEEEH